MLGLFLRRIGSLPKSLRISPVGSTVRKNTNPISKGLVILCISRPNFPHAVFNGVKRTGKTMETTPKVAAVIKAHIRGDPLNNSGNKAMTRNIAAKIRPKVRLARGLTVFLLGTI